MNFREFCKQEDVQRVDASNNGTLTLYTERNRIVGWVRVPKVNVTSENVVEVFKSILSWNCVANGQNINVQAPVVLRGEDVMALLEEEVEA